MKMFKSSAFLTVLAIVLAVVSTLVSAKIQIQRKSDKVTGSLYNGDECVYELLDEVYEEGYELLELKSNVSSDTAASFETQLRELQRALKNRSGALDLYKCSDSLFSALDSYQSELDGKGLIKGDYAENISELEELRAELGAAAVKYNMAVSRFEKKFKSGGYSALMYELSNVEAPKYFA